MGRTPSGARARRRGAGLAVAVALGLAALTGCGDDEPAPGATETTASGPAVPSPSDDDVGPAATPTTTAPAAPGPTASVPSTPATAAAAPTLGFDRLGPARLGMTMDEFGAALGLSVTPTESSGYADPCWFERLGTGSGLAVMTLEGREGPVVRIDVSPDFADDVGSLPRTERGLGVGSTADEVRAAHAGQVEESPHAYGGGQYLTVTDAAAPPGTAIVFETDEAGVVTRMRSGLTDPVGFVEGCS